MIARRAHIKPAVQDAVCSWYPQHDDYDLAWLGQVEGRHEHEHLLDFLATLHEPASDATMAFCAWKLAPLMCWSGPDDHDGSLAGVSVELIRSWALQQLSDVQTSGLPGDLGWAVNQSLMQPSCWSVGDYLRVVHACEKVELSHKLQTEIDRFDMQLRELGCRKRTIPTLVGFPGLLEQYWRGDALTTYSGYCRDGVYAVVNYEYALAAAERTRVDHEHGLHVLAHEMIHTLQSSDWLRDIHPIWLEGMTELLTREVTPLRLRGYKLLTQQVEIGLQEHCTQYSRQQLVDLNNGVMAPFPKESIRRPLELQYIMQGGLKFADASILHAMYRRICEERLGADLRFSVEPDSRPEVVLERIGAQSETIARPEHNPYLKAAALLIWAAHVMEEPPLRVLRWACLDQPTRSLELFSIAQWQLERNPIALEWACEYDGRSSSFWVKAMRAALDVDIDWTTSVDARTWAQVTFAAELEAAQQE